MPELTLRVILSLGCINPKPYKLTPYKPYTTKKGSCQVDLGKPFWRCTEAEIKGSPPAAVTYVYKSFGDMPLSHV